MYNSSYADDMLFVLIGGYQLNFGRHKRNIDVSVTVRYTMQIFLNLIDFPGNF